MTYTPKAATVNVDYSSIEIFRSTAMTVTTAYQNITFDTIRYNDGTYTFTLGSSFIMIKTAGWYEILAEISSDNLTTGTSKQIITEVSLYKNAVVIPGSYAYAFHYVKNTGTDTATSTIYNSCAVNDQIAVGIKFTGSGTCQTIANAVRLRLRRIHS